MITETPVEHYMVDGHNIIVKRDDLFLADCQPLCPALAKLRGAFPLLQRLQKCCRVKKVGVFDTRVSKAGRGIAFLCRELGMDCEVGFPLLKGTEIPENQRAAEQLGAKLYPLKAGRTAVCYHQFKRHIEENGGVMLPLGLVCRDTVLAVRQETERTIRELEEDGARLKTIVVCTGTGTIATGIHLGSQPRQIKVIGVSCGMAVGEQLKRMKRLAFPEVLNYNFLELVPPEYDYYTALDTSSCPFPTSPWYDMKAWVWMLENMDKIEQPILFWNIGA